MQSRYVVAQLGARRSYAVPRILHAAGMLHRLFTDSYGGSAIGSVLRALPSSVQRGLVKRFAERSARDVPTALVTAFQGFGLEYARRCRSDHSLLAYAWGGEQFCRRVVKHGFGAANALYTFNTAGLEALRAARARGMRTVVEQTIAPASVERKLLAEELATFRYWQEGVRSPPPRALEALIEREEREWEQADAILCGSEFVRDGLVSRGIPASRCFVIPYGIDHSYHFEGERAPLRGRKLRVLTVGAVGLRKGSPYVLEAAKRARDFAEFRMVGPVYTSASAAAELAAQVQLVGAVPRSEVLAHYRWADVFLLPSVCEGSAESSYEALACGLPVIATPNAGTIVRDGVEGFIVANRASALVAERLERLASDPALLSAMASAAQQRSTLGTMECYAQRLIDCLRDPRERSTVQTCLG